MNQARREALIKIFQSLNTARLERVAATLQRADAAEDAGTVVEEVLRELHTLKGEATVMGYDVISSVARALESRLGAGAERWRTRDERALLNGGLSLLHRLIEGSATAADADAYMAMLAPPPPGAP